MRLIELDDLEVMSGWDNRKIYELDVYEAIERERQIRRDKDDVKRFKVGLDNQLINEFDSIVDKLGYSEEKIRSAVIIHGLSIIQYIFGKTIDKLNKVRIMLINCDMDGIHDRASSLNTVLYERQVNVKRRNITIPNKITGTVEKICKPLFLDSMTFYQVCMAYSLFTRNDMIPIRRKHFERQINKFVDHVRGQRILFKGLSVMAEEYKSEDLRKEINIDDFVLKYGKNS